MNAAPTASPSPPKTYREREGEVYFGQNLINRSNGTLEVGMDVEVLE